MSAQGEISSARFRQLSQAVAVVVVGIGFAVLLGWWRDIDFLKSVLPGANSMKVNTALCFILAGLALWLLQSEGEGLLRRDGRGRLGQALALMVILMALVSVSQDLTGWNLGIDQVLAHDSTTIGVPGRIAPMTALAFVLLGSALVGLDARTRKGAWPALHLAVLAALVGFGGLIGYAFSGVSQIRIGSLTVMAFNTSITLLCLCAGILLARSRWGILDLLTREGPGGSMARWLLPAAVVVPFVLGWLRLLGENAGLYDTELGVAMFTLATIAILGWLIYRSALALEDVAARRRQAEEELNRFFSISMDLLCIAGTDGYFKVLNPRWEEILGYSQAELLRQPYLKFVHPDDRAATLERAEGLAKSSPVTSFENRYHCRDGSYRWFSWTATAATERGLIYAAARDVTERKQADLRIQNLNRELGHKLDELAAVNQELEGFSYSVAHDLRAPLRHVDGFSKILLEDFRAELREEARGLLERVRDGAQQMGKLIDELLNFSRLGRRELERQITGLNTVVEEVRASLGTEGDGRSIEWRIGRLPYADCDPVLMKQLFSNLLGNAVKYTRPREQAVIEVGHLASNGETAIFVRDNGVGFDMKYAGKLFGVFQRLHRSEDFEGTGVGLALAQRIVHKHGGRIWVEAALDHGATFYFTLGAADGAPQQTGAATGGVHGG